MEYTFVAELKPAEHIDDWSYPRRFSITIDAEDDVKARKQAEGVVGSRYELVLIEVKKITYDKNN